MINEQLMLWACVFLGLFAVVAAVDGLYFHLWKYRLYARAESVYEHRLHTARAFLFIPIVFFLFYQNFGGLALWLGVAFIAVDLVVEMLDVADENRSRAALGGLSSAEYAAHVLATTLRTAFIALALAAKPAAAWSLSAPLVLAGKSALAETLALNIIPGNFALGVLHLWLLRGKYRAGQRLLPVRFGCC